jgi:hypothetical protein
VAGAGRRGARARARAGLPVETVVADARDFALGRRFALVLVPMQTLQLLGGRSGRAGFLRCALDHLEPGGLVAAALADAMDCFDDEHDQPPPPDAREVAGVRYSSRLVSVVDDGGRAAIHRRREITGPLERRESAEAIVRLDRATAAEVAAEAAGLGFVIEPSRTIPETEQYLGSTVVVLRAPRRPASGPQHLLVLAEDDDAVDVVDAEGEDRQRPPGVGAADREQGVDRAEAAADDRQDTAVRVARHQRQPSGELYQPEDDGDPTQGVQIGEDEPLVIDEDVRAVQRADPIDDVQHADDQQQRRRERHTT